MDWEYANNLRFVENIWTSKNIGLLTKAPPHKKKNIFPIDFSNNVFPIGKVTTIT